LIHDELKQLLDTAKDMLRENIDTVPAHGCRREEVLEIVIQIEKTIPWLLIMMESIEEE
tara:strand:- start:478 stop:654 length:177 start_codon:yes stop_codon:yes gene_type:complete